MLDGVGAGIFGALTPLVIADIMRGTGRYNLAQGAIATVQGIGASLSGLAAGEIVDHFGYSAAFLTLGAAALVALVVFAVGMPETADREPASPLNLSPLLCRFLGRLRHKTIHALPRQASEKRQGTKSRVGRGSVSGPRSMGI